MTILPRDMVIEEFLPLVGQMFDLHTDPAPIGIRLVDARPLVNHAQLQRPPFILVFHSSPQAMLVPGGYVMKCGTFGPDIIHIHDMTPPPGAEAGFYYQAVFN